MAKIAWMITAFFVLFFMNIAFAAKKSDGDQNSNVPYHPMGGEGSLTPAECPAACKFRCSATSHKKPCLFYCNECCAKCLCVPSGTYGHKDECPCYRDWKTKEGGPKCP